MNLTPDPTLTATPTPAPERTHFPVRHRRSEAPRCTSPDLRVQAAYWLALVELEASARRPEGLLPHEVREAMDPDEDYESLDELGDSDDANSEWERFDARRVR